MRVRLGDTMNVRIMAEANLQEEKENREGAQRVANLIKKNIDDSPKDARTCKIIIRNESKYVLTDPSPFPMCCRSVGDPPPHEIIAKNGDGCAIFSKPRWMPFGCCGLLSYKVGSKKRLVIMFRNPMIQLTQKSKSSAAVVMVGEEHTVNEDLYRDMAFNWERSSYYRPGRYTPAPQFKKQIAAHGEAELFLDDVKIKFYMTQDTNAVLTVTLLPGRKESRTSHGPKSP